MPVDRKAMISTTSYLETHRLNYIFSTQGLLQWQLMFYSKEHLKARYIYNTDRYPEYVNQVNSAYTQHSAQTALVGFTPEFSPYKQSVINLQNGFSIYPAPPITILKERGNEF